MINCLLDFTHHYPNWLFYIYIPIGMFVLFAMVAEPVKKFIIKTRWKKRKQPVKKK